MRKTPFGVIVGLSLCRSAAADVLVLEPAADATIFWNAGDPGADLASGSGDGLYAGRTYFHADITQRSLLRFEVGDLPANMRVLDASLHLHLDRAGPGLPSAPLYLRRVLAGWSEGPSSASGGQGEAAQAGDCTWSWRSLGASLWVTPGGDAAAEVSGTAACGRESGELVVVAGLAAEVEAWRQSPGTNHGWMLLGDEVTRGSARKFASREHSNPLWRPVLVLTLVPACDPDMNQDGSVDQDDVSFLIDVIGGGGDPGGVDADYNRDGNADQDDVLALIDTVAGGGCP